VGVPSFSLCMLHSPSPPRPSPLSSGLCSGGSVSVSRLKSNREGAVRAWPYPVVPAGLRTGHLALRKSLGRVPPPIRHPECPRGGRSWTRQPYVRPLLRPAGAGVRPGGALLLPRARRSPSRCQPPRGGQGNVPLSSLPLSQQPGRPAVPGPSAGKHWCSACGPAHLRGTSRLFGLRTTAGLRRNAVAIPTGGR